ncbi:hypothetical protein PYCC9005_003428 [Savitreella phatthalungensis]
MRSDSTPNDRHLLHPEEQQRRDQDQHKLPLRSTDFEQREDAVEDESESTRQAHKPATIKFDSSLEQLDAQLIVILTGPLSRLRLKDTAVRLGEARAENNALKAMFENLGAHSEAEKPVTIVATAPGLSASHCSSLAAGVLARCRVDSQVHILSVFPMTAAHQSDSTGVLSTSAAQHDEPTTVASGTMITDLAGAVLGQAEVMARWACLHGCYSSTFSSAGSATMTLDQTTLETASKIVKKLLGVDVDPQQTYRNTLTEFTRHSGAAATSEQRRGYAADSSAYL